MSNRNYRFHLKLFIIFTSFLLLEGFFYYYSYKLSYFCFDDFSFSNKCNTDLNFFDVNRSGFNPLIWNESKIVESVQILFLILTIYHLIKNIILKNKYQFSKIFLYFLYFYTAGIIYFFLEEISWGQHYLKWETFEKNLTDKREGLCGLLERAKGFEPSTSTLARLSDTN